MRVHQPEVPAKLCVQIGLSVSLEELSVSVVDQRAWLATGVVRRLLLHVVLVLGGAFAVTVIGWLLCAGPANADVLPPVPNVPSVLSSVSSDATAVIPKKIDGLSTSDLSAVGRRATVAVKDVGERVAPAVTPAADLVTHTNLAPLAAQVVRAVTHHVAKQPAITKVTAHPSAHTVHRMRPALSRPHQPLVAVVQHRHLSQSVAPSPRPASSTPSPVRVGHHAPVLPPLQPAGSSDSSGHGGGSVTGGPGGAQIRFTHVIGEGLATADTSSSPRIAAGPGRQPGTSPD
jgi:hypothetical protein